MQRKENLGGGGGHLFSSFPHSHQTKNPIMLHAVYFMLETGFLGMCFFGGGGGGGGGGWILNGLTVV